jgi:hypothetical protein
MIEGEEREYIPSDFQHLVVHHQYVVVIHPFVLCFHPICAHILNLAHAVSSVQSTQAMRDLSIIPIERRCRRYIP